MSYDIKLENFLGMKAYKQLIKAKKEQQTPRHPSPYVYKPALHVQSQPHRS